MNKKIISLLVAGIIGLGLTGCNSDADIASYNLSKAADQFEIDRRIVFYNGITGEYMLEVVGKCALGNHDPIGKLTVTCKHGENDYRKHFLGLSDNVTFFAEQIKGIGVNVYNTRIVWKPQSIIPDIDFRGDTGALKDAVTPDNND